MYATLCCTKWRWDIILRKIIMIKKTILPGKTKRIFFHSGIYEIKNYSRNRSFQNAFDFHIFILNEFVLNFLNLLNLSSSGFIYIVSFTSCFIIFLVNCFELLLGENKFEN